MPPPKLYLPAEQGEQIVAPIGKYSPALQLISNQNYRLIENPPPFSTFRKIFLDPTKILIFLLTAGQVKQISWLNWSRGTLSLRIQIINNVSQTTTVACSVLWNKIVSGTRPIGVYRREIHKGYKNYQQSSHVPRVFVQWMAL